SPMVTSGIRLGSPALTTRGLGEDDFRLIGTLICDIIDNMDDEKVLNRVRSQVQELCKAYPTGFLRLEPRGI
ncbi:MAG: serine hydroxymethyltransferase, partial [Spirochaetes bacterium]|nr:serine hydroxymethyltransferase [Spirochaetota bacterium]